MKRLFHLNFVKTSHDLLDFLSIPSKVLLGIFLSVSSCLGAQRPNIIFILCDDLGYGDVGVFFQNLRATQNNRTEPWHFTPQFDTMAAQGLRMPHHYCPAPVCAPSRASLLTGTHQGHANVRDNQFDKALENNHTLGTVLQRAGYATACIGKWGLQGSGSNPTVWPAYPTKRGFDYYFGYVRHGDGHEHYPKEGTYDGTKQVYDGTNEISAQLDKCYTTDLFTARAKKWIMDQRATNAAQPFFLYLSLDTPHAVLELPTQAYPAGRGTNGGMQWLGTPGAMISTASGTVDSYYHPDYAGATYDHDTNATTAEVAWPDVYRRYATDVRRIDDCVGDLLQLLRDLAVDTNTLVIFTTDNGPSKESYLPQNYDPNFLNSFGPFDGIKRDLWEGGIRVGALAWWPGGIPGNRSSALPSQFHDWLPTFCDLAGLAAPARCDGVSLVPDLTGSGFQRSPTVYVEYYEGGTTPGYSEFAAPHRGRRRNQMQMLRLGDHVGVRYNVTAATNNFEIYNILADPQQTNNLATNTPFVALQTQMQRRVLQLRRPDSSAARPYDNELVPATTNTALVSGVLDFAAYEGSWPWVPNFDALSAVSTGRVAGLSLGVRPRDTHFGLKFTGYIEVVLDGLYTFRLASDSGAVLRIHEARVIDDDFDHDGSERSATIRLQAGRHPFRLCYRHESGPLALQLKIAGPGLSEQAVPLSFFLAEGGSSAEPFAGGDLAATPQNTPLAIPVLANDRDDGLPAPLVIAGFTQPRGGTVTNTGNQLLYTPRTNFLGEDSFSYTITDGQFTRTARVSVKVFFQDGSLWFPFNQTSGLTTDDAGGAYTATLQGFASDTAQWVAGRHNRALLFDGAANVVVVPGFNGILGTNARTIAAWVKTTSTNSQAIVGWGTRTAGAKWSFILNNLGQLRQEVEIGYAIGTASVNNGQWHHVAVTFASDGSPNVTDVKFYVDGQPDAISGSSARAINTANGGDLTVGRDNQDRFFDGTLDEVRIETRALGAAEISALFSATNAAASAWHRRHFGNLPQAWAAHDDADAAPRLVEYALGAQPHLADPERFDLYPEIVGQEFRVRFARRLAGTHELLYTVQASPDLLDWSAPTTSEVSVAPMPDLEGFEEATYRANAPAGSTASLFLRLRVRLP